MATEPDTSTQRRLTIHCGVQKTASTSLHHFVGRNRAALAGRLLVLTPEKGTLTRDLGRTATRFSQTPTDALRTRFADVVHALRDQLLAGSGPALISHENLPGAMIGNGGVTTLYPHLEEIIAILDQGFAPLVPDYVFYTREMDSWKRSVYNQAVKTDHYPRKRQAFLEETANCGTWAGLQNRMQAAVGKDRVRFFRLEDEARENRPATQLLRHVGLTDADIDALEPVKFRSNQSLNAGALEFLRQVNGLGLDRKVRAQIGDLVIAQQSLFATDHGGAKC